LQGRLVAFTVPKYSIRQTGHPEPEHPPSTPPSTGYLVFGAFVRFIGLDFTPRRMRLLGITIQL
jgi:hypothetical protein